MWNVRSPLQTIPSRRRGTHLLHSAQLKCCRRLALSVRGGMDDEVDDEGVADMSMNE